MVKLIQESLYIDDLMCGVRLASREPFYHMTKRMMSEGGFNLTKWVTNSPKLSRRIGIAETVLDGPLWIQSLNPK